MPVKPRKNKHRWRELFKNWNENGYNSWSRLSSIPWARFWAVFGLGRHLFLLLFGDRSYETPIFHYYPSLWVSKLSVRVRIFLLLEFSRNGDPRICTDGGGDSLGQPSPPQRPLRKLGVSQSRKQEALSEQHSSSVDPQSCFWRVSAHGT